MSEKDEVSSVEEYPMPPTPRFTFLPDGIVVFAGTPEELLTSIFDAMFSEDDEVEK